jgi:2'-5' RNA ligase
MRCFIGICPDPISAARLSELARDMHARYPHAKRVSDHKLHVTLAFIGELAVPAAVNVASALETLNPMNGTWPIKALGAFQRAGVLWAGGTANEALAQLAADVRTILRRQDVPFDPKPFAAHVTLLRNLARHDARTARRAIDPPINFQLTRPALIVSTQGQQGSCYRSFVSEAQG